MSEYLDPINSYVDASKTCKCGCLDKVNNHMWKRTQTKLLEARKKYKPEEKSKVMQQMLHNKLKEHRFEAESDHVALEFMVEFELDDEENRAFYSLCESCFVAFNAHISYRTWGTWKKDIKHSILVAGFAAEASAALTKRMLEKGATQARYENIKEARKALQPLGFEEEEFFQWACVPDNAQSRQAYLWLYNFISLVGDNAPNRNDKIQIPGIYTQATIHKIYVHHITTLYTGNEHPPLGLRAFETLWKNIFPNVTISKYCQVSGKCFSCHALYERQEVFTCEEDLKEIRKLASVHKILIEMQRQAYMGNRQLAQERPDMYMSLILDGMAQDHCQLPYYAGKATPSTPFIKQKIVGAKQHGLFRTFYRTYPHVHTGANLACETLLHEIERRLDYCLANNEPFPRVLLLQIDGGSENTAKTFYALLEHLVRQGVFDRIEAARLPVGHTHEDIDAMFGVLWRAAQGKTIITPQQWKEMAISAFNQTSMCKYSVSEDVEDV